MILMIVNRPLPCTAQSCEATLLSNLVLPVVEPEPFPMYGVDRPCFDLGSRSVEGGGCLLCRGLFEQRRQLVERRLQCRAFAQPGHLGFDLPLKVFPLPCFRGRAEVFGGLCELPCGQSADQFTGRFGEIWDQELLTHGRRQALGSECHGDVVQAELRADDGLEQAQRIALGREGCQRCGIGPHQVVKGGQAIGKGRFSLGRRLIGHGSAYCRQQGRDTAGDEQDAN